MTQESLQTVILRWMDALNSRDSARIDQLVDQITAPDYVLHDPGRPADIRGPEGVRQWAHGLIQNSSMIQIVVDDLIREGDRMAVRATATITRAASGKTVRFPLMFFNRISGEKTIEEWELTGPRVEIATPDAGDELLGVVKGIEAALNNGDLQGFMASFAEGTTFIAPPEGAMLTGKPALQEWIRPQLNHIQVDSRNYQVSGDTVTWEATLTGELIRQAGLQAMEQHAAAVVKDGQIASMALTVTSTRA